MEEIKKVITLIVKIMVEMPLLVMGPLRVRVGKGGLAHGIYSPARGAGKCDVRSCGQTALVSLMNLIAIVMNLFDVCSL